MVINTLGLYQIHEDTPYLNNFISIHVVPHHEFEQPNIYTVTNHTYFKMLKGKHA